MAAIAKLVTTIKSREDGKREKKTYLTGFRFGQYLQSKYSQKHTTKCQNYLVDY